MYRASGGADSTRNIGTALNERQRVGLHSIARTNGQDRARLKNDRLYLLSRPFACFRQPAVWLLVFLLQRLPVLSPLQLLSLDLPD